LGDVTFGKRDETVELLDKLHGHIHLVRGNHDHSTSKMLSQYGGIFDTVQDYASIKLDGHRLILFHYPIMSWDGAHHGSWHMHGHSHGNLKSANGPMIDVGVDCWHYGPLSWDIARLELSQRATS
jgi:calcineurin-like phosphoesterase family protein